MVNFPGTRCVQRLMATAAKVGLWGDTSEESDPEKSDKDLLISPIFEDELTHPSSAHYYIYQPGDGCDVIDDGDGINLLWLRQIQPNEISLQLTRHGKVQVSYLGQPIIRMRGIDLIRTDNGCYSLDYWLNVA